MKIALYLGSFNPFHNGHLEVVKTALYDFKMNGVIIIPTMQNPWKKEKVLNIDKRIEIIKKSLLISKKDISIPGLYQFYYPKGIRISSIEKELIPPYYSYATLHALKNKYCNDEVFVLCGEDTIKDIPDWMNGGAIIQDYNFLICDRSSDSISSTEIRNKIKKKEDISKYVNVNVIDLIEKYYE
jgi:nicotinate-nucleotide adenylyltransferase